MMQWRDPFDTRGRLFCGNSSLLRYGLAIPALIENRISAKASAAKPMLRDLHHHIDATAPKKA